MLKNIPTHVIAGPLGAGKTSLIRHLLQHKPADERWAVLINEFGQIGLDAALLTTDADGISLAEVAGGCLCCVNGAPFQVGLGRLLRKARPDRLLIEPSGLGHPLELLRQLRESPWTEVLAVQAPVLVLDAAALAAGESLAPAQGDVLDEAGLLVLNKVEGLDALARARLAAYLPDVPQCWTSQGRVDFDRLPGHAFKAGDAVSFDGLAAGTAPLSAVWGDPQQPICQISDQAEGWSIGWRWHPAQRFELMRLQHWLAELAWRRAKLVMQTNAGWLSANALQGQALHWQNSEWRRDSRLELIFQERQDAASLQRGLRNCLVTD